MKYVKWLIIALLITSVTYSCKKKYVSLKPDPAFIPYISGFSGGLISTLSTIKVRFTQPVNIREGYDDGQKNTLFQFEPEIKGSIRWSDAQTVEFVPDNRLPSGKNFNVHFAMKEVIDVPQELSTFSFSFRTISQSAEIIPGYPRIINSANPGLYSIDGTIECADVSSVDTLAKCLKATHNGNELEVKISKTGNPKRFNFRVDNISRGEAASQVRFVFEGKAMGNTQQKEWYRTIPGQNTFEVLEAVGSDEGDYIQVYFSDPLDESQDYEGLVTLRGMSDPMVSAEGSVLTVYPASNVTENTTLGIYAGIRSSTQKTLATDFSFPVRGNNVKPAVRFPGQGTILPQGNMELPFEAVNLNKVDVEVIKILENNIAQFFQYNRHSGASELKRVGKVVLKKTISLDTEDISRRKRYSAYTLKLNQLVKTEPGAIYRINLNFNKSYSTFPCGDNPDGNLEKIEAPTDYRNLNKYGYFGDEFAYYDYYYDEEFDWNRREDPCSDSYYAGGRGASTNVLASDIGLIAKKGEGDNWVFIANSINTALPIEGVRMELLDYQLQKLVHLRTDAEGIARFSGKLSAHPFLLTASYGNQKGYLRLIDGEAQNVSRFDVSGDVDQEGINGFIFGERGVWRPGDTLFLNFMLNSRLKDLGEGHPIVFELTNPQGQLVHKEIKRREKGTVLYPFTVPTAQSYTTGNYSAQISIGSSVFYKLLKIETIMPNRLKIEFPVPEDVLRAEQASQKITLRSEWLHGAPAQGLRANVSVKYSVLKTEFRSYPGFIFDDPSRRISSAETSIFDGKLNDRGEAELVPGIRTSAEFPGKLKLVYTIRVFEPGGAFSIDRFSVPYLPYSEFTGIKIPTQYEAYNFLNTDRDHLVELVSVNDKGNPLSGKDLTVNVYRIENYWWWQEEASSTDYRNVDFTNPVISSIITTNNQGKANFPINISDAERGSYFLRVCDEGSGHCSGDFVYFDRSHDRNPSTTATKDYQEISLRVQKPKYSPGEEVQISFPSPEGAQALVSLESGSTILKTFRVQTDSAETTIRFKAGAEMSPNVYAHITVLQPHKKQNDLPLRMYGVVPVFVEDPATHLYPEIKMPNQIRPESPVDIQVNEKSGKSMEYRLAIVDEGLLDITRFKTPDPWSRFYSRKALGVSTWDLYNEILGAYGGEIAGRLSIGGDGSALDPGQAKANRFPPVVKVLGPFRINPGKSNTHRVVLPEYTGSVRVMVIAGNEHGAWGNTEKSVTVKKPLMVLSTLPRVFTPGDTVRVPVNIFTEKGIHNVRLQCKLSGNLSLAAKAIQDLKITGNETLAGFDIVVGTESGVAKVTITATSGNEKAISDTEIEIRYPNPEITDIQEMVLKPGQSWSAEVEALGIRGTSRAVIEFSGTPPLNLSERMDFLMGYPHGCIEQTTSAAFPQLYLAGLVDLKPGEAGRLENNVKTAIRKIGLFQTSEGGFGYWQGALQSDAWGSSYAGHFLLEASRKGYAVNAAILNKWKKYQKQMARLWNPSRAKGQGEQLNQAYRLYTLALSGDPEPGAMNRLREMPSLTMLAGLRLAAAYHLAGHDNIAKALVNRKYPTSQENYYFETYGSDTRDWAMQLETAVLIGDKLLSRNLAIAIAAKLGSRSWMSTQTAAYSLLAMSKYYENEKPSGLNVNWQKNGEIRTIQSAKAFAREELDFTATGKTKISVSNPAKGNLYLRIIRRGVPSVETEFAAISRNLEMKTNFTSMNGAPVNPGFIEQGTDFIMSVTVSNPGQKGILRNLALETMFPSGWEIDNARVQEVDGRDESKGFEYQDIRDDRVYTYFDLKSGESTTFKFRINASYIGNYFMPAIRCSAMYDNTVVAQSKASRSIVFRKGAS